VVELFSVFFRQFRPDSLRFSPGCERDGRATPPGPRHATPVRARLNRGFDGEVEFRTAGVEGAREVPVRGGEGLPDLRDVPRSEGALGAQDALVLPADVAQSASLLRGERFDVRFGHVGDRLGAEAGEGGLDCRPALVVRRLPQGPLDAGVEDEDGQVPRNRNRLALEGVGVEEQRGVRLTVGDGELVQEATGHPDVVVLGARAEAGHLVALQPQVVQRVQQREHRELQASGGGEPDAGRERRRYLADEPARFVACVRERRVHALDVVRPVALEGRAPGVEDGGVVDRLRAHLHSLGAPGAKRRVQVRRGGEDPAAGVVGVPTYEVHPPRRADRVGELVRSLHNPGYVTPGEMRSPRRLSRVFHGRPPQFSMPRLPPETSIGRVSLRVGDLDSVLAFYRDAVGLRVHERTPERAVLGAADPCLELRATEDPPRRTNETGLYHTAFRVPDRAALGDALDRVDVDGASDHLVSEALYTQDPEGNGVEIYRDKPRVEWPDAPDGEVRMDTLPLDLEALRADAGGAKKAPETTDVGHVHLEVSSLPETRAFYADALGLAPTQELRGALFLAGVDAGSAGKSDPGVYHHHVGANVWRGRSEPPTGRGLDAFELRVPADDIERAVERLRAAGHTVEDGRVSDPSGIDVLLRAR